MKLKFSFITLFLSLNCTALEVEVSLLDVEFGKKLPFPLIVSDYKPRDSFFRSFRVAQKPDAKINQFYDFEVRTSSDLLVYSVKGVRAYSSSEKCQVENDKVYSVFASTDEYTRSNERLVSFKHKTENKFVSIGCITQEGSPSWYLSVEIYNRDMQLKHENF